MQKIIALLVGVLVISPSLAANSPLDSFTREELIDRLTSVVPIKEGVYGCSQVVYNYSLSKKAVDMCSFSRLSSAADTGNIMCHSWAISKADGSLGKMRSIAKEAEKDFDEKHSKSLNKGGMCSAVLKKYSDFIVE